MIFATFGQVRFAYYLAVNVALIGGFACDRAIEAVGAIETSAVSRALATCVVMCLVILPGVPILRPIRNASAALNSNWYDALMWMGANTPEPFRDPRRVLSPPSPADSAVADYGVLALWDYGYWITRVARRVPVTNPRQTGVREAADFLLSSSELDANSVIERLGARYVAVDWRLPAPSTISGDTKSVFNGIVRRHWPQPTRLLRVVLGTDYFDSHAEDGPPGPLSGVLPHDGDAPVSIRRANCDSCERRRSVVPPRDPGSRAHQ